MIGMLVGLNLFIISWVWVHICAPVKFLTFFPTWANNRNLILQEKLQNGLCSCTSYGYMWNTNEICDTYAESSWYKLLKNARKSWNNHKSYITILDKNTQKWILWYGKCCLNLVSHLNLQQIFRIQTHAWQGWQKIEKIEEKIDNGHLLVYYLCQNSQNNWEKKIYFG